MARRTRVQYLRLHADIDEARSRHFGLRDTRIIGQGGGDFDGELTRIGERLLRLLRKNHRRIGGEVAMRRVARRLDDKSLQIQVLGQAAACHDPVQHRRNQIVKIGEKVHRSPKFIIPEG